MIDEHTLATFRNPQEYLAWFDSTLEATKECREEIREQALLHKGAFKRFYEEVFPLALLLQHKRDEWSDSAFRHICADTEFDVEIRSSTLPFSSIEITCTTFDEDELFRMRHLACYGEVSTTAKILRDCDGKRAGFGPLQARSRTLAVNDECGKIRDRIYQKCKKHYASGPALVVFFDDASSWFEDADYRKVEETCRCMMNLWSKSFSYLFAVGCHINKRIIELEASLLK